MIDDIAVGRRGVVVEVTKSELHGTACRLTVLAAAPLPGHKRLRQSAFLFTHDVDRLIAALGKARGQLIAANAKRDAKRPSAPTPMRARGAPPASWSAVQATRPGAEGA